MSIFRGSTLSFAPISVGHGIREYETSKTRAWFVTTGYVVRLLANHPSWFDSHTHLIIDEGGLQLWQTSFTTHLTHLSHAPTLVQYMSDLWILTSSAFCADVCCKAIQQFGSF